MRNSTSTYIVGIAGGTASGKTSIAQGIVEAIGQRSATIVPCDNYYHDLSDVPLEDRRLMNFDHPNAIDFPLLVSHLNELKQGRSIEMPVYDFRTCTRTNRTIHVEPCDVVIIDGILVLVRQELRELLDLRVFVDLDAGERIIRRTERDIVERGRTFASVADQYRTTILPMHESYVEPSKQYADQIVSGSSASRQRVVAIIVRQILTVIAEARPEAIAVAGVELLHSATSNHKEMLENVARSAWQELRADSVTIHQYDALERSFLPIGSFSATWPPGGEIQQPRRDGLSSSVIGDPSGLVVVGNIDEPTPVTARELVKTGHLIKEGIKAFVGIRLEYGNQPIGLLYLNYKFPRQFRQDELNTAQIFSVFAALAISVNRLRELAVTRLSLLNDIGTQLLSTQSAEVTKQIVMLAKQVFSADHVTLHQFDSIRNEFLDVQSYSASSRQSGRLDAPRQYGISRYIVDNGTTLIQNVHEELSAEQTQTRNLIATGTQAFIGIRLESASEVVGVLFLNFSAPRVFDQFDRLVAEALGAYSAIAVRQQRLLDDVSRLSTLAARLRYAALASVKEMIVQAACSVLRVDSVTLHQYDQTRSEFLDVQHGSAVWPTAGGPLQQPRADHGFSALVLRKGLLEVPDIEKWPDVETVDTERLRSTSTRAFLGMRLEAAGEYLGVLFLNYQTERQFTAQEKSLLEIFVLLASYPILVARSRERDAAERRVRQQKIVQDIANAVEVHTDFRLFLQSLLESVLTNLAAPRGTLQMLNRERGELEIVASVGLEVPATNKTTRSDVGITGRAFTTGQLIYVPDTSLDKDYLPLLGNMGSEMAVPLLFGDMILGVLNIEHPEPSAFDEDTQALFELVGRQTGSAIHQKLKLDNVVAQRQQAEQEAFFAATVLDFQHHIGNKVGSAKIRVEQVLEDYGNALPGVQRGRLEAAVNSMKSALKASDYIREIRRPKAKELTPPHVLVAKVQDLLDEFPDVKLQIDVPKDLPEVYVDIDRTAVALKDIVANAQKAILAEIRSGTRTTGTIKIAGESSLDKSFVMLKFTNDGPPIEQNRWSSIFKGPGYGLPTVRSLVESQGGSVTLAESNEKGTTFEVSFPIASNA